MKEVSRLEVDMTDVYQLLISAGRYAYTRNNHLEPHCFYRQAESIVLDMFKVDEKAALNTLKQLVEECIDKELFNFTGEDSYGNKAATVSFIEWGIKQVKKYEPYWTAYNINLFEKYK